MRHFFSKIGGWSNYVFRIPSSAIQECVVLYLHFCKPNKDMVWMYIISKNNQCKE